MTVNLGEKLKDLRKDKNISQYFYLFLISLKSAPIQHFSFLLTRKKSKKNILLITN